MSSLKVLVTGSTGFLGAHVARRLLSRKYHVITTYRDSSNLSRIEPLRDRIQMDKMDLLDNQSIENIFKTYRPDAVIHCGAYGVNYKYRDLREAFATNVHGTSSLIHISKATDVSRFIHIGSCFEYGHKKHPIYEDEHLKPTDIYGVSKASSTLLALALSQQHDLPLTVARPFGLWGPLEEKHRLVPQVISHCLAKKPLKLTNCRQIRDYTFIEDAAAMLIDLLELQKFPSYEILNLGSGVPVALKEFVIKIASTFNQEHLMRFGELPYRPTEMWRLVADVGKWEGRVGKIRRMDISEGLERFKHLLQDL